MAVVYTSGTLSLAALEYFVHVELPDSPADLVAVAADIPDDVTRTELGVARLPATWRTFPAPEFLAHLGTSWVVSGRSAVLLVASALIPQEWKYLLNPAHPEFRRIRIRRPEPFRFDRRMWKR